METKTTTLVEATIENIKKTFEAIEQFAKEKGYQIKGNLKVPTNLLGISKKVEFDSKNQLKVLKKYLTRLNRKITLRQANMFLHFLFQKGYHSTESIPYVEFSERELKIQEARKAWKVAAAKAEEARLAYRTAKGDFYKSQEFGKKAA